MMIDDVGTRKYENTKFDNFGNTALQPRVSPIEHSTTNSYQQKTCLMVVDGKDNQNAKF